MNLLIKQARIVDPLSPFDGHLTDVLVQNGKISRIGAHIAADDVETVDLPNLHLSPGWVDIFSDFGDPGFEYRESLSSGAAAAAAGGFTDVFVIPNTKPALDDKSAIEYVVQKSRSLPVAIHPVGAITVNAEGKELAEMFDMHNSGALAFSDGLNSVQSSGLLVKALQYVKTFHGILIQVPDDRSINPHGLMNEGIVSTQLGLAGKPSIAEELIIARDIKLARYAESRIHFTGVSTATSLAYIREARASGVDVTCSVTPHHLYFNDTAIASYNSNLKVNPPLREKEEQLALIAALESGTIDCIASHHFPHDSDSKVVEFEYARAGMIGLETAFAAVRTAAPGISIQRLVELFSINARKLFGLPSATIAEGADASLTLFDPGKKWKVSRENLRSKSFNSAFIGLELTGKPLGILRNGRLLLN